MIELSPRWASKLAQKPPSGTDYHVAAVLLRDGRKFEDVVIVAHSLITQVRHLQSIPFVEGDIADITVTRQGPRAQDPGR